ncbi:hypothetical protein GH722_17450 [Alphaproteobacteria bacterium HT1-32]|nr:hypothetical protein [Alphaproteobacteria bacterium HT1-32]
MRSVLSTSFVFGTALLAAGSAYAQAPLIPLPPSSQTAQLPPPSGPIAVPQPASSGPQIPLPASPPPPPVPARAVPQPPSGAPAQATTLQPKLAGPTVKERIRDYVGPKWSGYALIGPAYRPEYFGGNKSEVGLYGDVRVDYDGKLFAGLRDGAGLVLVDQGVLKAGPRMFYRFGREANDSAALTGLQDVDDAIELGGFMSYVWRQWEITATLGRDVSDAHDGWVGEGKMMYEMQVSPELKVKFGPSATWANQNYMRSFYGVTATEAAATGLRAYDPKSGFRDVTLGVEGEYSLDADWSLNFEARLSKILQDAADSPLVEDRGDDLQLFVGGGAKYNF